MFVKCVHKCAHAYTKLVKIAILYIVDYTAVTKGSKYFKLEQQPHKFLTQKLASDYVIAQQGDII